MIKFKQKSLRRVQIIDSISVFVILIGVFFIHPEPRCIAYDVYVLAILTIRVLIPFFLKSLKFRYYMTLRYFILAICIGFASIMFVLFSKTHPNLYILTLGTTLV